jgi:hypothetical protein
MGNSNALSNTMVRVIVVRWSLSEERIVGKTSVWERNGELPSNKHQHIIMTTMDRVALLSEKKFLY